MPAPERESQIAFRAMWLSLSFFYDFPESTGEFSIKNYGGFGGICLFLPFSFGDAMKTTHESLSKVRRKKRKAKKLAKLSGKNKSNNYSLAEITASPSFLRTFAWRKIRMDAIKLHGARCQCCGATPSDGFTVINVDHIKPRKTHPELALTLSNLQILCNSCNHGKGNTDTTDWRIMLPV